MNRHIVNLVVGGGLLLGIGSAGAGKLQSPEVLATLVEAARSGGYGENPPALKAASAFCGHGKSCRAWCSGTKAIVSKVDASMASAGLPALVDPALAIQDELRGLGCAPSGGDPRNASENCGIRFLFGKGKRNVQPSVVKGLARAALEAGARGYSLLVGSTFRSAVRQTEKVCKRIANHASKECGSTIACPGGSKHGMGFAIDVALVKNGKRVTPITGVAKACKTRIATVKASPKMQTLMEIMFAAGWAWYCQELWHFEHSSAGTASRIRSMAEMGLAPKGSAGAGGAARASGAKAVVDHARVATTGAAKRAISLGKKVVKKAGEWLGGLWGKTGYITASSVWVRSKASSKSSKVVRLRRCEKVSIVGESKGWRAVNAKGKGGHVYYKYVSTTKPSRCG